MRKQLEPLVKQIRAAKAQLDRLTKEIEALVAEEKIPVGLGALTVSLIDGELMRALCATIPRARERPAA